MVNSYKLNYARRAFAKFFLETGFLHHSQVELILRLSISFIFPSRLRKKNKRRLKGRDALIFQSFIYALSSDKTAVRKLPCGQDWIDEMNLKPIN